MASTTTTPAKKPAAPTAGGSSTKPAVSAPGKPAPKKVPAPAPAAATAAATTNSAGSKSSGGGGLRLARHPGHPRPRWSNSAPVLRCSENLTPLCFGRLGLTRSRLWRNARRKRARGQRNQRRNDVLLANRRKKGDHSGVWIRSL